MLQIVQNGLHNAKTLTADSDLPEKSNDGQLSSSFDEIFQAAQVEEPQKAETSENSIVVSENVKAEDFSDVMRVSDEKPEIENNRNIASENKKNHAHEHSENANSNAIKSANKADKNEKLFDKAELTALLSKKYDKKANVNLEINLERLPKDVSAKIKKLAAKKPGEKVDIEKISRDIGALLLSQFQMKEKNTDKKVTSETFAKNVSSAELKNGKLVLKGSEKLKQLKITGKSESPSLKENNFSIGLKELLFSNTEQLAKNDVPNNKADSKIDVLSVNNDVKAKKNRTDKTEVASDKDKNQKALSSQTKDVLEIKNGIKENFSMPINNKQADSQMLAKSFQEQKAALYEQVTKQTKVLLTNDKVSFSTFIRPEELGRVDFKFVTKDGKVNGKIILQNQEAADLFRSSVEDLRAVFQRANVELDKLEIHIAGRQTFETGNFDFSGNSNNPAKERNAQTNEKAAVSLHHAVKAFDDGAAVVERSTYSGNGIHLVI